MKVYLNEITGIADAIVSMYMSKRTWTREKEREIRALYITTTARNGRVVSGSEEYDKTIDTLIKFGARHITMLRFVDFSVTVEGLHRGGQDDWDSHAKRFENRIIRSSTRLSDFGDEKSEWYDGKILTTDEALSVLKMECPGKIEKDGQVYVKTVNGYIREDLKDNRDVKRGLYMLSIPSNFIFKVNMTEFAHVYKERNENGTANPEVKLCCEMIADEIEKFQPKFNRKLFMDIQN